MTSNIDAEKCAECPMPFGKHLPDCSIGADWNTPTATECSNCASYEQQLADQQRTYQFALNNKAAQAVEWKHRYEATVEQARQYHSEVEALTLKLLRLQRSGLYECGCHDDGMCLTHLKLYIEGQTDD